MHTQNHIYLEEEEEVMVSELQLKRAKVMNVSLENLSSYVKSVVPSENKVTRKEIMSILTKKQKETVEFVISKNPEITIQHLDPRQNRYNSVRYQQLKTSGHYLGEKLQAWKCHQEGCEFFSTETKVYFIDFTSKTTIQLDTVRPDDISAVGSSASVRHLFDVHPEFSATRLKGLGVSLK